MAKWVAASLAIVLSLGGLYLVNEKNGEIDDLRDDLKKEQNSRQQQEQNATQLRTELDRVRREHRDTAREQDETRRTVAQLQRELEQTQTELAEAHRRADDAVQAANAHAEEQEAAGELVICPYCNGDYKHRWETCERKGGIGCDGRGYRTCFECSGRGDGPCSACNGTGKVKVNFTQGTGNRGAGSRLDPCNVCGGDGRVECKKCGVLYVRLPKNDYLEPIISQGQPLRQEHIIVCGYRLLVAHVYDEWIRVEGNIICPRCSGKGKVKVRGPCPYCTEGKIEKSKLHLDQL